jgi:hypothetical protein
MSVSILTITQYKRRECIEILFDIIVDQTYKSILEWVIVEGSPSEDLANLNKEFIEKVI